eukprot:gene7649-693_t
MPGGAGAKSTVTAAQRSCSAHSARHAARTAPRSAALPPPNAPPPAAGAVPVCAGNTDRIRPPSRVAEPVAEWY